jgi:hypothetical protein
MLQTRDNPGAALAISCAEPAKNGLNGHEQAGPTSPIYRDSQKLGLNRLQIWARPVPQRSMRHFMVQKRENMPASAGLFSGAGIASRGCYDLF